MANISRHFTFFNLFLLLAVLLFVCAGMPGAAQTQNWTLIWSDNFAGAAGSAPNPDNWTLQQGLTADGAQSYNCLYGQTTNGCNPATPNVYLDGNNHLIIQALAASGAPNGVTSGRLFTSNTANTSFLFSTQYGRVEAEMVLPAGSGNQGVWPAFWMLGTNISEVNWPSCGEMDIMEYIGAANETQIYSTLHGQPYADTGLGVRDTLTGGWSGTHIFGAIWSPNQISFYVDEITNIIGTISTDDIMANQSWDNGGLAAWPFNNPMFIILDLNMGGPFPGNVSSATTYPQILQVNYVNVYQATAPAPPTGVTATANSQSQVALNWTGSTSSDVTYNVYRTQVSGVAPMSQAQPNPATLPQTNQTLIANNITATTYTDANLSPGQTYYYTVTASGEYSGESDAAQVKITTPTSGVGSNGGAIYVSAAGYSGTGNYIVNSLVSGGFTNAFTNTEITSDVTNPAPQDVYHSERWGPQTWTIAHLTPGGSYNVRMHFAESAWTAAGQRQFNVLIDGEQVLTNFDIFATAGAQNTVITETFNTIADHNGVIYLQLAVGAADQPEIRALDVTPSTGGVAYGEAAGDTTYVAIDAGGPGGETAQVGTFEADEDAGSFGLPANPITQGGGTNTTTQTISTSGVTDPAPVAVYQTERYGAFGYFFTGLAANSAYTIRIHLAEGVAAYDAAGYREFNVVVNGNQLLTNYDIYANAGALYQAVIPQVTGVSDEHGMLSVQFTVGYDDLPSVRGIEVIQSSTEPTAATPTFSPVAGSYTSAQTVTISDTTSGATIYYTTNGTTPTTSSAVYSEPITVSSTETVEAIATASGYTNSTVGSAAYTITTPTAATPTFSPAAGSYTSAQTVTISDTTSGATIHYTTNGTTPTTSSAAYSGPITVSATETLEAIAAATGYNNSAVGSAAYTITGASEGPYGGTPAAIPGKVLAENYDTGGQGVGYNVTAVYGTDNSYRSDGVDLEVTSATGGGNDIGWTAAGQWFRYTVNVATAGTYTVTFEVAAPTAVTDGFHISNSAGTNLSGSVNVPATGGYQTWVTVTATVTLPAGQQVLTINQDNAGWNIYSATFASTATGEGPYGGTPAAIPGKVLAENYDTGGQGVGYSVTAVNGTDNSYRSDGVDLEVTSATGGGNDIGWTAAGQWFRYTVNVATAGTYTVTFVVAAPTAVTDGFHISNSAGTNLSGSVNVPATGGWQTWTTVTATVTLPAGQQVLTINQDNAGWNIYSATFAASSSGGADILDINSGGTASGSYLADEDYSGGTAASTASTISTTGVVNPAPEAVYQSQRYGNFTYTLPGFTAGTTYVVRLHFDEFYWTATGKREFNVLINGTQVLTDFDVFATAGGEDIAVVEQFNAVANSSGQIVIQFVSVIDNAEINGIEIEQ
jgi:trimeric autotransporter adhesin